MNCSSAESKPSDGFGFVTWTSKECLPEATPSPPPHSLALPYVNRLAISFSPPSEVKSILSVDRSSAEILSVSPFMTELRAPDLRPEARACPRPQRTSAPLASRRLSQNRSVHFCCLFFRLTWEFCRKKLFCRSNQNISTRCPRKRRKYNCKQRITLREQHSPTSHSIVRRHVNDLNLRIKIFFVQVLTGLRPVRKLHF